MSIEERKKDFVLEMRLFSSNYTRDVLNKFYLYWTQVDKVSGKMRFERQKSFFIKKRLFVFNKKTEQYRKKNTASDYLEAYKEVSEMIKNK